jgi:methylmalonyl-CoA mutase N-terminal domain/subunit
MVRAIEQGYPQQEIQDAAWNAQRDLEEKRSVVVGVNAFQVSEPPVKDLLRVDESVEARAVEKLAQLRRERNNEAATRAVDAVKRAAASPSENLIPFIYDAVKAEATLGEISDALRDVFGEHRENVVL